jgi:hypothetical protein
MKKKNQDKKRRPFGLLKLQMALAQSCKNRLACLCGHLNISIIKGRNKSMGYWLE